MPARRVSGGLQAKPIVHQIDDDLGLPLGLHVAAHDAKGEPGLAAAGGEAGMMVWNGRLPGA